MAYLAIVILSEVEYYLLQGESGGAVAPISADLARIQNLYVVRILKQALTQLFLSQAYFFYRQEAAGQALFSFR
jgi:hypothetical protein